MRAEGEPAVHGSLTCMVRRCQFAHHITSRNLNCTNAVQRWIVNKNGRYSSTDLQTMSRRINVFDKCSLEAHINKYKQFFYQQTLKRTANHKQFAIVFWKHLIIRIKLGNESNTTNSAGGWQTCLFSPIS